MAQRAAVVDIGSGTTTLAVFDAGAGGFLDRVSQSGTSLRLIEQIDPRGRLSNVAAKLCLSTVSGLVAKAREAGADHVEVVATSAMRDAVNGAELVAKIGQDPAVRARLISGEEEGELAAHSVLCTLPLRDGVVLDLGGGSLQLVRVRARRVVSAVSLPLGALRLSDAFLAKADPPSGDALCALRHHAVSLLRSVPWLSGCGGQLVAIGGGARSLGKMDRRRNASPVGHGHGYFLPAESVLDSYERLSRLPSAERAATPGLPEHRVDTIVAAALVISTVLRLGVFAGMHLSTYGIREGVAFRVLFGDRPIADPGAAGIRGRLKVEPVRPPPIVAGLTQRERRLFSAAMDRPAGWLLAKPIQGFWQEEVLRVAAARAAQPPNAREKGGEVAEG